MGENYTCTARTVHHATPTLALCIIVLGSIVAVQMDKPSFSCLHVTCPPLHDRSLAREPAPRTGTHLCAQQHLCSSRFESLDQGHPSQSAHTGRDSEAQRPLQCQITCVGRHGDHETGSVWLLRVRPSRSIQGLQSPSSSSNEDHCAGRVCE